MTINKRMEKYISNYLTENKKISAIFLSAFYGPHIYPREILDKR